MKIMGVRASASEIRYAIIQRTAGGILFLNRDSENRLKYPTTVVTIEDKLFWVKQEFDRIFRQNMDVDKVVIKTNEYGSETKAKRETTYVDAIIQMVCAEKKVSVVTKLYTQIGATSSSTKKQAERRMGKTDHYWNTTIADALNCAYMEETRSK